MSFSQKQHKDNLEKWSASKYAEFNAQNLFKVLETEPDTEYSTFVGRPVLAADPDGDRPHFFFNGFADLSSRHIFHGRINEDFEVTDIEILLEGGYPSSDWNWTRPPCVTYDGENENWLITSVGYYSPKDDGYPALFRFSEDFGEVIDYQAPMQVDGGDWWTTEKVNLLALGGADMLALSEFHGRYRAAWTTDFTATLPTWSEQNYLAYRGSPVGNVEMSSLIGYGANQALGLQVTHYGGDQRGIHPVYLHYDQNNQRAVGGIGSDPILGQFEAAYNEILNGVHLTSLPDRRMYNMFFGSKDYPSMKRPIIWCRRITEKSLNPRNQRAITYTLWDSDSISAGDTTYPMPGYGRKTIKFTSDTSGDLSVEVYDNNVMGWVTLDTFSGTTKEIQMTDYSAGQMRLKFSAAATVSAVVTTELGV